MLKKMVHGFIFGVGFTLAIILVIWGVNVLDLSFATSSSTSISIATGDEINYEEQAKWRKLPDSEKLIKTTGFALLRFKEGSDKHMEAYVEEVLFKDNSTKTPLNVGDRVEQSDYYAQEDNFSNNRNGVLILYTGSPSEEVEQAYLYDDKLVGYGDMPLALFLKKFKGEVTH